MRRDKSRPAGCTPGRGAYRMREPMIPVNKLSTSGIDENWHKCADEARSVADDMKDEISKQIMLQIADDYERLAKRAAHREPGGRLKELLAMRTSRPQRDRTGTGGPLR